MSDHVKYQVPSRTEIQYNQAKTISSSHFKEPLMAKRSLADLAAAFAPKTSSSTEWKDFFPFWKANVGTTTTVRFLPDLDEENPMGYIVENLTHELYINGKKEIIACGKMHGDTCPICDHASSLYEKEDKINGKKFYRKKNYIGQVLVLNTPIEHDQTVLVKLIEFGPALFKQHQSAFTSGDLEEAPYEFKGGYDYRIRKTQDGQFASYATSSFAPKQSDVSGEVIAEMTLYDLKTRRAPAVSLETLKLKLQAAITGGNSAPAAQNKASPGTNGTSQQPSESGESSGVAVPPGTSVSAALLARRTSQEAA